MTTAARRWAAATVALLAALAALAAPRPAAAECDATVTDCTSADGAPVTYTSVAAILPLARDAQGSTATADVLYRRLVAGLFAVPAKPEVAVVVRSVEATTPAAGETRVDGIVALKVVGDDGEVGWFPIAAPTSGASSLDAMRAAGMPAYTATGAVTAGDTNATTWDANVEQGAASLIEVDFLLNDNDNTAVPPALGALATLQDPSYSASPFRQGPARFLTDESARPLVPVFDPAGGAPGPLAVPGVTALAPPQIGSATVTVGDLDAASIAAGYGDLFGEGESFATLADVVQPAQAVVWTTDALLFSQTDELGGSTGGGNALPVPVPAQGAIVAPLNGQVTGFVLPSVVLTLGSTLTLVANDTTQHNIACADRDPVTRRPLCRSDYLTGPANQAPVRGVESLPAGTYKLNCELHPNMVADLTIL